MEKLIEEIPAYTAIRLYPLLERFHFSPDWETLIEIADEIVSLVGKAFRDGELDEYLGVAGRYEEHEGIITIEIDKDIALGALEK